MCWILPMVIFHPHRNFQEKNGLRNLLCMQKALSTTPRWVPELFRRSWLWINRMGWHPGFPEGKGGETGGWFWLVAFGWVLACDGSRGWYAFWSGQLMSIDCISLLIGNAPRSQFLEDTALTRSAWKDLINTLQNAPQCASMFCDYAKENITGGKGCDVFLGGGMAGAKNLHETQILEDCFDFVTVPDTDGIGGLCGRHAQDIGAKPTQAAVGGRVSMLLQN